MAVAMVSPMAGHRGTRGRQSTSVSCSSDSRAAGMKLSPASFIAAANSGARHNDSRLTPERFAGPANFHDVRACVSADLAPSLKSHVAFFWRSDSAALIGKPQFQIEVTRLPLGPLGQRAEATLPTTFDCSGLWMTAADECASIYVATVPCEKASAMSGQFQLRTPGGEYWPRVFTYQVRALTASEELTTMLPPPPQLPPNPRSREG